MFAVSRPDASENTSRAIRTWQLLALAAAAFLATGLIGDQAVAAATRHRALAAALAIGAGIGFVGVSVVMVGLIVALPLEWKAQLALVAAFGLTSAAAKVSHIILVGDLSLFVAATMFGVLVSRVIREPNMIVPVAVAAAAVDTYGVYWGFVAMVAKRAPALVQQLSAAVPGAAAPEMPVPLLSAIGIGDYLFMGLLVAAVYRLHMQGRRTLWALFIAFLAVPLVFVISSLPALPGLPFLGLAVVVANWRHFRFSRAEKFALLYAAGVVAAIALAAWGLMRTLGG